MNKLRAVKFRKATKHDVGFLSEIIISAALASEVILQGKDLSLYPGAYQYIDGFPREKDVGLIAETSEGTVVGAAWLRLLPNDAHAIHEHLPELTMGVIAKYQGMGIGESLMKELYKAAFAEGISQIALGVHKNNIPAINLYKKQNWIEDGTFNEYIMMSRQTKT